MSVHYIPVLIDGALLASEIAELSAKMPREQWDGGNTEVYLHDGLEFDRERGLTPYEYAKLDANNSEWWREARDISLILMSASENLKADIMRNADTLYRFLGLFVLGRETGFPFNEYGFAASLIMGVKNTQLWHTFFQRIDFELLRPLYHQEEKRWADARFIHDFGEFVDYAKALDGLLVQAIEMNRTLYMVAMP